MITYGKLTGVLKGTFWKFYAAACRQAYTKLNIKSTWRKTGIHLFNLDAVLTQVTVPRSVLATNHPLVLFGIAKA